MQKVVSPGKFAFSDYELDVASRLLTRRGETVSIAPRALECLIYLIQHADRAVGRDELISAVWGRTDINYTVLTQTLWKLRRALNESSDADSQFIRTVSRFGYQWIAPQVPVPAPRADLEAAPSGPSRDSGTIPTTEPKSPVKRRWRKVAGWGAAAAVILALLILVPVPWQDQVQSPARDEVAAMAPQHGKRFLVLPARMDVSNPDDAWVNLGLMDYLATNLRRHDRLQVVGSDRVLSLLEKSPPFDPDDADQVERLKRVAGATDIVAPVVTRTDLGWRIVVTLHNAEGSHQFGSVAGHPLAAADDVARRLLQMQGAEQARESAPPAHWSELIQRMDAASLAGDYARGLEIARSASAEDRSNPHVRLKVAQLNFRSGDIAAAAGGFEELAQSTADVPPAVRISGKIGLAHIAEQQQRYAEAERGYSDALKLLGDRGDPALQAQALSMRGLVNTYLGRTDQGFADFARGRVAFARSGDEVGLAGLDVHIGLAERARGRHQDAADAFDRAIAVLDRFGMRDRAASALIGAIGERLALLQISRALVLSDRADTLAREIQSPIMKTYLLVVRGESLLADGRLQALETLLDSLGPAADVTSSSAIPDLLLLRVGLRLETAPAMSSPEIESMRERIENPPEPAYGTSIAGAMLRLSESALRAHDIDLARRLLERLQRVDAASDRLKPIVLALVQAQVQAATGDSRSAASFRAALAEADRVAYPDAIVTAAAAWARYLGPASDRETLMTVAGRLQPFVEADYRAARAGASLYAALGETRLENHARSMMAVLARERDPHAAP